MSTHPRLDDALCAVCDPPADCADCTATMLCPYHARISGDRAPIVTRECGTPGCGRAFKVGAESREVACPRCAAERARRAGPGRGVDDSEYEERMQEYRRDVL